MKKYIFFFSALAVILGCATTGCEGEAYDTGWKHDAVYGNGTRAYIDYVTASSYVYLPDATNRPFEVTVGRTDSVESLTVPLTILSGGEYFSLPNSVAFAAGQSTVTVGGEFTETEPFVTRTLQISLNDADADMYSNKGTQGYTINATITDWKMEYQGVAFEWGSTYDSFTADIWELQGTGLYRIDDFMYGGVFSWRLDTPANDGKRNVLLEPESMYADYGSSWLLNYLYPTINGEYQGMYMYMYNGSYSWMNLENRTGCFYMYADGAYNQLKFSWTAEGEVGN
ncbi:MAG: hypothetical protein LBM62_07725 [Mediterranea sp.]|nr:hypothetical protein [Mediterranea sp.]